MHVEIWLLKSRVKIPNAPKQNKQIASTLPLALPKSNTFFFFFFEIARDDSKSSAKGKIL